jgi:hypothetical protein
MPRLCFEPDVSTAIASLATALASTPGAPELHRILGMAY